jgi:hypothetical protein
MAVRSAFLVLAATFAQDGFDLGEELLDEIGIGTVGWQMA